MSSNNQDILRRVMLNDPSLTNLRLVDYDINNLSYGVAYEFYSENSDDYSALGAAIANNTQLEKLRLLLSDNLPLDVANREFYDGLKSNSSISNLELYCGGRNIAGGVGQEILKVYQENNSHLTYLRIDDANLENGGDRVIGDTVRCRRNLQKVTLNYCNITDEQLLPIADAIRGHILLEGLYLFDNNIGNIGGCNEIATLLTDPSCNLQTLSLGHNAINNEGATTIANSLTNNTKLELLYLGGNQIDQTIEDVFSNVLCNTSNINNTYASNHTLKEVTLGGQATRQHFAPLLSMNMDTNKSHVAIRKILKFQPNIDMEPFFEWDAKGDQTLKALPYVVNWFERAVEAVADDDEEYNIEERKLSSVFQFAKTMPILFEGISYIKVDNKKRKRKD